MKKRFSVVLIILISVIGLFFYHLASTRYQISSPMKDIEYKTSIIRDSHNIFFRLENLRPVVGEEELTEFIKSNNDNPQIYTPSEQNRENGVFRANLHMHTLCSDGRAPVKKGLTMRRNTQKTI